MHAYGGGLYSQKAILYPTWSETRQRGVAARLVGATCCERDMQKAVRGVDAVLTWHRYRMGVSQQRGNPRLYVQPHVVLFARCGTMR